MPSEAGRCHCYVYVCLSVRTLVTFYVVNVVDNKREVRPGVEVVSTLAKKLRSSTDAFDFRVVALNTVGEFSVFLFWLLLFCLYFMFTYHCDCTTDYRFIAYYK